MTDNGTKAPEEEKVVSITGEAIPAQALERDIPESARKELKTLIWVGIVSIWLCLAIVVMLVAANNKNLQNSTVMAKQLSVIGEEVPVIKSELSSVSTEVPNIKTELSASTQNAEKILAGQAAMSEKLIAELGGILDSKLSANAQQVNEAVEKILAEQQKVILQIDNLHNSDRMTILRKFFENQSMMLNQLNEALENSGTATKE